MKPKKLNKLLLNKKTIVNLFTREMTDVHGGGSSPPACFSGDYCITRYYPTCLTGCVTCTGNPQCAEC
jgi:hypothetical protein